MADLWFKRAIRVPPTGSRQGLMMLGGGKRYVTWHTFEGSLVRNMSAEAGARFLNQAGTTPTFCLSLAKAQIAQLLPMGVGCYTLENAPGNVETNRAGDLHAQIEVLDQAAFPFTDNLSAQALDLLAEFLDFLDDWGVPRIWPAGQPAATAGGPHNRIGPGPSGHYGHSQWRDQPSGHWDPGAIDISLMSLLTKKNKPDPKTKALQQELYEDGFLSETYVSGIMNSATQKAMDESMAVTDEVKALVSIVKDLNDKLSKLETLVNEGLTVYVGRGEIGVDGLTERQRVFGIPKGQDKARLADITLIAGLASRRVEVVEGHAEPEATARMREWASTGSKPKFD